MTPPSLPLLAAFVFALLPAVPPSASAYQENHPGLAIEWSGNADGEVTDTALGDADGDGFPDLFVLSGQHLQVWRNDGHGVFAIPTVAVSSLPLGAIVVADVDHDGHVDVLGVPAGAAGLAFLRGLGGGQFADPVVWPMGGVAYGKMVALDPFAHELIATRDSGFDLLRHEGDSFVVVAHALEGEGLWAPTAADVDGDGVADVIVSADQAVEVMLRRGDTFEHGASLTGMPVIETLASADLDGDGDRDIVGGDEGGGLHLFFNSGAGTQWSLVDKDLPGVSEPGIAVADVDQDGRDELFVGVLWSEQASYIAEYQCVDDPMLSHPAWFSHMFFELNRFGPPNLLLTGDLNRDGRPDLVAIKSGPYHGTIGAILTRPDGWPGAIRMLAGVGGTPARFHAGGPCDVLLSQSDGLAVARFGPDGTLGPARRIGDGRGASVIDLNGDGIDDLVVNVGDGQLEVRLTGASGVPDNTTARLSGNLVLSGDLDHDGRPELLFQPPDAGLSVAWNDSHARFRRITPLRFDAGRKTGETRYVIADVDGDGRGELVELIHHVDWSGRAQAPDSVQTYRLLPSGLVRPLRLSVFTDLVSPLHSLGDIRVGDLDGRAGEDIAFTSYDPGNDGSRLYVLLAQPDGSFVEGAQESLVGESPGGLLLADLDGDGDTDIVGGARIGGFIGMLHIFWNNGAGDFSEMWSRRIAGGINAEASAGDLDGDGVVDLLIGAYPRESPFDGTGQIATLYGSRPAARAPVTSQEAVGAGAPPTIYQGLAVRAITPNPASGTFEVQWSSAANAPVTIDLIDIAGRRVQSVSAAPASNGRTTFDHLDGLPTGLYWIRLRQGRGVATQRVVLAGS